MTTFQLMGERISDVLRDSEALQLIAWEDAVIDELGHDPRGSYCEKFWLPVVGPTVYLMGRRFADWLEARPAGVPVPLTPFAFAIGIGSGTARNAPLVRSLARLCAFGLARLDPNGERLAFRRHWPPLTARSVNRLPGWLATEHEQALREQAQADLLRAAG